MVELLLSNGPALAYLAIIAVLVLTGMGLPIPEEVPVITAGVLSSTGQLDPTLAFIACLIGAIAGDCVMYWIGFHFGRSFLRERHWWARVVSPEREAMIERQIQTHGFKVFFRGAVHGGSPLSGVFLGRNPPHAVFAGSS